MWLLRFLPGGLLACPNGICRVVFFSALIQNLQNSFLFVSVVDNVNLREHETASGQKNKKHVVH